MAWPLSGRMREPNEEVPNGSKNLRKKRRAERSEDAGLSRLFSVDDFAD